MDAMDGIFSRPDVGGQRPVTRIVEQLADLTSRTQLDRRT